MPGGTGGTNINDVANWVGAVIDGDFSSVVLQGTTLLVLTNDLTFADVDAGSRSGVSFSSGSTDVTFTNAVGIETGQLVSGTGIPYNTFLIALDGTNGVLSQAATAASSGSYSFIRPALAFDFGVYGTRTNGVSLVIGSSPAGVDRTITVDRRLVLSQQTSPRNEVTFTEDVIFNENFADAWSGTRESGGAGNEPLLTVNGPVFFADGNGRAFGLNGGDCTFNGPISGVGRFIDPGSGKAYAGVLTLTHSGSTFDGGVRFNSSYEDLVADSTNVLANTGTPSALGAGGDLSIRNQSVTLKGFILPQVSDRAWLIGGGTAAALNNDGTAPLILNGLISNPYADGIWKMQGSYHDYARPNIVNGQIANQPYALGVSAAGGVWRMTNDGNSFTGTVSIGKSADASLQFTSISNHGIPSSIGAGDTISFDRMSTTASATNGIEYLGKEDAITDRTLRLDNYAYDNCHRICANGRGALVFSGLLTNASSLYFAGIKTRTLVFGGTGNGAIMGTASLADVVDSGKTARVAVAKIGTGTWRMAGTNFNYQGATEVRSGNLVVDYSHADQLAAAGTVFVQGGGLTFKGAPAGPTADTMNTMQLNDDTVSYRCSTITLDANGGDGVGLTVGKLNSSARTMKFDLFDLASSAGNSVTVDSLGSAIAVVNSILMGNKNRANILVKTTGSIAFATLSGTSSGTLQPLTEMTSFPLTGYANTVNYLLNTPGTTTPTADPSFCTLTIASSGGPVTLDLGTSRKMNYGGNGRAILVRGGNDVTISGDPVNQQQLAGNVLWFHNFLDDSAVLNVEVDITSNAYLTWDGPGASDYAGQINSANGVAVCGGVLRLTRAHTPSFVNNLVLTEGGVLEICADLNGAGDGDFSLALGAGAGKLALYGDAGFSAAGGDRTVNFGGAGATLTWGSGGALVHASTLEDYGYRLKFSSARSDATVTVQNPIDLNGNTPHGRRRTIEVANGSATVDARLSGAISGHSTLVKTGAGTLEVTASQDYDALEVCDGTFRAASACFTNDTEVCLNGGTLTALGTNAFGTMEVATNSVLTLASGSVLSFAGSEAVPWNGTLNINGAWVEGAVRFGSDSSGLSSDQIAHIAIGSDKVALTPDGYLHRILSGTMIRIY